MSSTTERSPGYKDRSDRGQILIVFAFGLIGIIAIAALVFDAGQMLLNRRAQQNASDAAALAGARYLVEAGCKVAPNNGNCPTAVNAAMEIATKHGYQPAEVSIAIPPTANSNYQGLPGYIEVRINTTDSSIFGRVLGFAGFNVGALAVARNFDNFALPYSFLALDPHSCKSGWVAGNGTIDVEGEIMVSSDCTGPNGALTVDGSRAIMDGNLCSTAGSISVQQNATFTCPPNSPVPAIGDPLASLGAPAIDGSVVPDPPSAVVITGLANNTPPDGCPGSSAPSTEASPTGCIISGRANRTTTVRMSPGVYWGGIKLSASSNAPVNVYLEPGIYYMAGGGWEASGSPLSIITVAPGGTTFTAKDPASGVMIYNDDIPSKRSQCIAGTIGGRNCIRTIDFQNTGAGFVKMNPYKGRIWTDLLMFQARDASSQPPVKLTGGSNSEWYGTIYLPKATFEFAGGGATSVFGAQVISWQFKTSGNGDVVVTYDPDDAIKLSGTGLVQ